MVPHDLRSTSSDGRSVVSYGATGGQRPARPFDQSGRCSLLLGTFLIASAPAVRLLLFEK